MGARKLDETQLTEKDLEILWADDEPPIGRASRPSSEPPPPPQRTRAKAASAERPRRTSDVVPKASVAPKAVKVTADDVSERFRRLKQTVAARKTLPPPVRAPTR